MPQDIPVEASEVLAFTPPSLAAIPDAPSFVLRTATSRDKRHLRRLHTEEGIRSHDGASLRKEILRGLEELWSADAFAEHSPILREYWDARDAFELQRKDEPDLKFEYDEEIERGIDDLVNRVVDAWPKLRSMMADNADYNEMLPVMTIAAMVKSWTGMTPPPKIDRGYLTIESTEALKDALWSLETEHADAYKLKPGAAFQELTVECLGRMFLSEDVAKNSESPSPSKMTPPVSTETTASDLDGKSPASASSSKTPATK